jgi:hypothetical protein
MLEPCSTCGSIDEVKICGQCHDIYFCTFACASKHNDICKITKNQDLEKKDSLSEKLLIQNLTVKESMKIFEDNDGTKNELFLQNVTTKQKIFVTDAFLKKEQNSQTSEIHIQSLDSKESMEMSVYKNCDKVTSSWSGDFSGSQNFEKFGFSKNEHDSQTSEIPMQNLDTKESMEISVYKNCEIVTSSWCGDFLSSQNFEKFGVSKNEHDSQTSEIPMQSLDTKESMEISVYKNCELATPSWSGDFSSSQNFENFSFSKNSENSKNSKKDICPFADEKVQYQCLDGFSETPKEMIEKVSFPTNIIQYVKSRKTSDNQCQSCDKINQIFSTDVWIIV